MNIQPDAPMTLTVLGCQTPYPRPDEPCSGYLLRAEKSTIWIDAGSGTFAELQLHVQLQDINAIWISHLHPDHYSDLLSAWNAYANTPSLPQPLVFGPPGWRQRVEAMLGQPGALDEVFTPLELHDRYLTRVGPVELRAYQVEHSVPTFALQAQHRDRLFAYSADSGPCPQLVDLAQGANLLLIEAGASKSQPYHCTAEDVGDIATAAQVSGVMLTHLAPELDREQASTRVQARFTGTVDVARPGLTIQI
ncbi:MBL fold metallo-hydrolase [Sphaerisporangium sp. NPDC049003]|uniref:MBL fold metallo-hydrolase n=1 Tax=Sphaerisporangium sp. NPDC049003 TaxID=3364517 RepID=UPI0037200ACC